MDRGHLSLLLNELWMLGVRGDLVIRVEMVLTVDSEKFQMWIWLLTIVFALVRLPHDRGDQFATKLGV